MKSFCFELQVHDCSLLQRGDLPQAREAIVHSRQFSDYAECESSLSKLMFWFADIEADRHNHANFIIVQRNPEYFNEETEDYNDTVTWQDGCLYKTFLSDWPVADGKTAPSISAEITENFLS